MKGFENYPVWVQELARKYFTKTVSQFILYGNVNDYVPQKNKDGSFLYYNLREYLQEVLFKRRDIIISYDRASGIQFKTPEMFEDFKRFLRAYDTMRGSHFSNSVPRDPYRALGLLENFVKIRLSQGKRIALIVDYAHTLLPNTNYPNAEDRAVLVYFLRWSQENLFIENDITVTLISESLNMLNPVLIRNPHTVPIDIPYPTEEDRHNFINYYVNELTKKEPVHNITQIAPEILATLTGGLKLIQIKGLLAEAANTKTPLNHEILKEQKKEIIEIEGGGLLGFVETKFSLKDVAGHKQAKAHLLKTAEAIKQGKTEIIPMGYLVSGPVGTGKTFLVSCFAKDIGIPMVELKNFRSQWVGQTEANLERIFKILEALSPVAVMIDEADATLGKRSQSGDSGVGSRVFSMIASFMSKTEHRGKIIWFLLTARPDLMPVDLKRQGRAEEHIALFYPETIEEKKELFQVMLRKRNITEINPEEIPDHFYENLPILSGADMEALLARAQFRAFEKGTDLNVEILQEAVEDFIPPSYPEQIELMNLVAVLECTSRELLPERFREIPRGELMERIKTLKAQLLED